MKYIIFNWKSYLNLKQTYNLSQLIASFSKSRKYKIISAPNNFFALNINSKFPKNIISAQNIDTHGLGASTGSLDISCLLDGKIHFCILGHSEVRSNFDETDDIVKKKLEICIKNKIKPIICIGESEKIYKLKKTKSFIKNQIDSILSKKISYEELIIAYEPLWSIGTGLTPKIDEINEISSYLIKITKKYTFKNINILYGGSVNLTNVSDILNLQNVNGVLVGSASTKPEFIKFFN